jgi:hypothetical protein
MQNYSYSESTLCTTNTKLAAVLMLFGFKLRRHQPFNWDDEYASKELYLRSLKDRSIKPLVKVTWNFELNSVDPREILSAFASKENDVRFDELVNEIAAELSEKLNKLKAAHSAAVAQAGREVLDHRDFLVRMFREIPEAAKWVLIWNDRGQNVRFGRNASTETQTEMLSRI